MKTKFSGILTLFLAFMVQITFAQQKTVSGTVSDDSGPLPGVSVVIKGTLSGTETDFDGKYSIKAKAGDVLQFSFVGMESQEKKVGDSNTINVSLKSASNVLDEVVVTAQGIKKEKKALGYAVSTVNEEQLSQRSEGDVARVLSGKTSG
ncbi:MAG: SusC/RagA family TonB-linked outer membrane protein, partial [Bacteroidetes bacterium]|nr:SusC/RagA family TonB-linked outer membrane protein [Bacteroidota bacterium]